MIKNKWMLYLSLIFLFTSMILNFPFPHKYPYGEAVITILNIPIWFANGFHTVGIATIFLLIIVLYFLLKLLKKNHGRILFIAILIALFLPVFALHLFQKTFATNIYAISYSSEESNSSFEMIRENTSHGECELLFKNYSNDKVEFNVEFYEELVFKDDLPFVSLINNNAPYKVTLEPKENKQVYIETDIDVSEMENHIDSGEARGVNIIISSNGKERNL